MRCTSPLRLPGIAICRGFPCTEPDQFCQRSPCNILTVILLTIPDYHSRWLYEALTVAPVRRHLVYDGSVCNKQEVCKAFTEFPGLAVAHKNRIAQSKGVWPIIANGSLHLARPLERNQFRPRRHIGLRLLFRANGARGDVASAQAGIDR